jgi:hypothetical protein
MRSRNDRGGRIASYFTLERNQLGRGDPVDRNDHEVEVTLTHLREGRFTICYLRSAGKSKTRQDSLDSIGGAGGICRNERTTLHQFRLSE